MSNGVNLVVLIGNLGRDPETRYGQNGNPVTNIAIATSESWNDKQSNQKQERTEWHNVGFFGKLAEIAGQYLKKGAKVYIEGSLRTSNYEKDGQKHYKTQIIANQMQMLDSKNPSAPAEPSQPSQTVHSTIQSPSSSSQTTNYPSPEDFDDDIPF